MAHARRKPVSTYRLQLRQGFGFAEARALVPYLDALGVTDCYSSPHLKANPGSTHGYDICDHSQLNPELGTSEEFGEFCDALRAHGLGHIVDIVPNHMACDPSANLWWRDVLENGPSSPYAGYFDVDWAPVKPELKGKVLLPILGDQYGRVLERGELKLAVQDGALHLRYFSHDLPINPRQSPRVLGLHLDRLELTLSGHPALREYLSILTALQNLPVYTEQAPARIAERQREKEVARERLARLMAESPDVRTHVTSVVNEANGVPGACASFDVLHTLLEHQAYRLAYWRTAFDEINYRRFFDINELIGMRMEEVAVFEATHGLIGRLVERGQVTGLRVDHPDGLYDPAEYFDRLQAMVCGVTQAADDDSQPPFYVAAEKILSEGERLRSEWPVAGTTGYGFLNLVGGLFIDGRQARLLRRVYGQITGRQETFAEVAYWSKRTIMLTAMASELNVLAHALNRLSERDRRSRDFTLDNCRKVLREVVACFPVYRTYISEGGVSPFDREAIRAATTEARRRNPLMEESIFDFLEDILLTASEAVQKAPDDLVAGELLRFVRKMQQFTGPVQAKGVEDTAFYRYHVLVSANDVGGHPGHLGVSVEEFHDANQRRLAKWPLEMVATATHDTKRGEDARLRISVLSEIPNDWRRAVSEWMRINAGNRSKVEGVWAPDRNDEYLFYQALVGMWPAARSGEPPPGVAPADVVARMVTYLRKAIREAKVHTSWIDEDQAYGRAVTRFVEGTLSGRTAARFLGSFVPLQRRISDVGLVNAVSQLVLKLASPGVPDFYQGTELWDFSLVDPDNRRPVDFEARRRALEHLMPRLAAAEAGEPIGASLADLLADAGNGSIKLFLTACGLRFRRRHAEVFRSGAYASLPVEGPRAEHLVAFARVHSSGTLIAIAPRLVAALCEPDRPWPRGEEVWGSTAIVLPQGLAPRRYHHLLTGETVLATAGQGPAGVVGVGDAFRHLPVALLWSAA
ncbi:MAG: malto-oligosyltrehalose synthase [Acidobacteriota bacterium]